MLTKIYERTRFYVQFMIHPKPRLGHTNIQETPILLPTKYTDRMYITGKSDKPAGPREPPPGGICAHGSIVKASQVAGPASLEKCSADDIRSPSSDSSRHFAQGTIQSGEHTPRIGGLYEPTSAQYKAIPEDEFYQRRFNSIRLFPRLRRATRRIIRQSDDDEDQDFVVITHSNSQTLRDYPEASSVLSGMEGLVFDDASHEMAQHIGDISCFDDASKTTRLLDRHSGTVVARVCQGSRGAVATQEALIDDQLHHVLFDTSGSPALQSTTSPRYLSCLQQSSISVPQLVLTLPTPELPRSPVFAPRSPITVSKFVSASFNMATASIVHGLQSPVPSVPACSTCSPQHTEAEDYCHSCGRQWLACKMWYQATDGGKRQRLAEPFIKPGESTANIREMMDILGIPGGNSRLHGLGLGVVPQFPRPSKERKSTRFGRILALASSLPSRRKLSRRKLPNDGACDVAAHATSFGLSRVKAGRLLYAKTALGRRLTKPFRVLTSRTRLMAARPVRDGNTRMLLASPSVGSIDDQGDELLSSSSLQLLVSANNTHHSRFYEHLDGCSSM